MGGKRVDIKTGFICNNNCRFCVQAHKKHLGNRPTEAIKTDLKEARKRCDGVVFTGGEVTVRDDVLELVSYAKGLGYKIIQIQTNGRMFCYFDFCVDMIGAGANEFAIALHGHNAKLHNFLTRCKGSFRQTTQGINNLKKLGQIVITNTVIVKPNYKYMEKIAKLLVKLGVDQFQFAFVHPVGNAFKNYNSIVPKIGLAAPYICKGLQIGIDAGVRVMAEATPYCMVPGYENYISEEFIPETEVIDADSIIEDFKKARIESFKKKFPQCKRCKYDWLCEGPWTEYPERMGSKEFSPIQEKKQENRKDKINITLLWTLYSSLEKKPPPNITIAYLSKILEKEGFEVRCIDCNLFVYDKWGYETIDLKNKGRILSRIVTEVEKTSPDVLAVGCWTEGISFIKELTKIIKKRNPHIKIILGGPLATFIPDKLLSFIPEADYLVKGEGELTLLELVKNISKGRCNKHTLGISYKNKKGQAVHNPNRPLIKELDELPLIDFENFVYLGKHEGFNIVTSRGCPSNCSYCPSGNLYGGYRLYSPKYVLKQIKLLMSLYGPRYIIFSDDNVLCSQDRARKLFGLFAKEKLDCKLPASGRIDNLNRAALYLMKKARVPWLTVGIENIVPKVLRYYNRTKKPTQYASRIPKVVKAMKDYGFGAAFSFVLGSPVETKEDILKNFSLMKELHKEDYWIYAGILRLVPGSLLWDRYSNKEVSLFKLNKQSTGFIFDKPYLGLEWVCPSNFRLKNNHHSNEQFVEFCNQVMGEISRLNPQGENFSDEVWERNV